MPVGLFEVDVLVGEVDSPRIGDLPVDNRNLAVVAVVVNVGNDGHERVELHTLDSRFAHEFGIPRPHAAYAADVVVDKAHLHAFRRLPS